MNRLTVLAAAFAVVLSAPACKKLGLSKPGPSASASASASSSAVAAKDAPPVPTGTTFTKKAPSVGDKHSETTKTTTHMKFTLAKKTNELDEDDSTKKDEEILEVVSGAVTKLKVTFSEDTKTMGEEGKPSKTKTSPLSGKTYIVAFKDGKTQVLNDKEKPAPKAEASLVTKEYQSLGKPDPVLAAIPDRAIKDGEDLPELGAAIAVAIKQGTKDDKMTIDSPKVTFKSKEGDTGIFDIAMTMKGDAGFFKMSMPLKGQMTLRLADAAPTLLTLEGPIAFDLSDKDKKEGGDGGGTIKLMTTATYPK